VGSLLGRSGKGAMYESSIMNLGYLIPPVPPDEMKRRRAMYKLSVFVRILAFSSWFVWLKMERV
jgi:hypothetical protein